MKPVESIIREFQVTEKATSLSEKHRKYMFRVDGKANKLEIKKAVESLFKVSVMAVNTMNYKGKKKRERTMRYGHTPDWKRAVVTLKTGDKIDLV